MQIVELEMVPLSLRPVLQRLYDMKTTQSALREGVLFSTKRNNYYYDTGTGKVIVLDDDTSYIFRVLFDPTLSAETFLISLTKVDPNAVKNLLQTIDAERLFQRPPLLSMGKEIAAGVTDTEQKVEQIILEVTEQCNFRCKYCVYSEDFSGNRDFGNRRMPTEIAFKAIDWALENSGAKLAITFYGGEPLLNFKLMKAVIERSQAKRGNKEIVYACDLNSTSLSRNLVLYGHTFEDGYEGGFKALHNYEQDSFAEEHPYIYLSLPDAALTYRVVSAGVCSAADDRDCIEPNPDDAAFAQILAKAAARNTLDNGETLNLTDHILTLSTCTGESDTRYLVVAKLVDAVKK